MKRNRWYVRKLLLLLGGLTMVPFQLNAGERLSLKDITSGQFAADGLSEVRPLADGEHYAQISSDGRQVVSYSFKTGELAGVLFDAAEVKDADIHIDGYTMSPDGRRMLIQTQTKAIYRRSATANYYLYTLKDKSLMPLSQCGAQQVPVFSPDGSKVAFVRENNIFVVDLNKDGQEQQVTHDGCRNEVINGIPDWVYEEEFSTNRSMVFTADSRHLVWIRYDESAVKQYSMQLFKGLAPEREQYREYPGDYTYKYPVPGSDNSKVSAHAPRAPRCRRLHPPRAPDECARTGGCRHDEPPPGLSVPLLREPRDCRLPTGDRGAGREIREGGGAWTDTYRRQDHPAAQRAQRLSASLSLRYERSTGEPADPRRLRGDRCLRLR